MVELLQSVMWCRGSGEIWSSIVLLLTTFPVLSCGGKHHHSKCTYNLIIHEVDSAVKCPKIQYGGNGGRRDYWANTNNVAVQMDESLTPPPIIQPPSPPRATSRFMHHAYRLGLEDLVKRVGTLETKLYAEMAENRELKNTMLLQEQWLKKVERYMHNTVVHNLTRLGNDVRAVSSEMDRHSTHYRSLDSKLSEVMLDVAEVNNYLAEGRHRGV